MKTLIFCVKDRATNLFGTPMFLMATGQATRSFSDEVNRKEAGNQLNMHPDDFDLYQLGYFDSDDGSFETHAPELVVRGKDVINRE